MKRSERGMFFLTIGLALGALSVLSVDTISNRESSVIVGHSDTTGSIVAPSEASEVWGGLFVCCGTETCPDCRGCVEGPFNRYYKFSNFLSDCYCKLCLVELGSCCETIWQNCSNTGERYFDSSCRNFEGNSGTCLGKGCRGNGSVRCLLGGDDC